MSVNTYINYPLLEFRVKKTFWSLFCSLRIRGFRTQCFFHLNCSTQEVTQIKRSTPVFSNENFNCQLTFFCFGNGAILTIKCFLPTLAKNRLDLFAAITVRQKQREKRLDFLKKRTLVTSENVSWPCLVKFE